MSTELKLSTHPKDEKIISAIETKSGRMATPAGTRELETLAMACGTSRVTGKHDNE